MPDKTRIQELLEEVLDSNRTPDEVCARDPDLLPEVRARWERARRGGHELDALFLPNCFTIPHDGPLFPEIELPKIDGYAVEGILGRGGMGIVFSARHL